MALYKDTYKCRKCGQTFTWYYQPAQEDGYGYRPKSSSEEKIAMVSGMMLVAEQIYEAVSYTHLHPFTSNSESFYFFTDYPGSR